MGFLAKKSVALVPASTGEKTLPAVVFGTAPKRFISKAPHGYKSFPTAGDRGRIGGAVEEGRIS